MAAVPYGALDGKGGGEQLSALQRSAGNRAVTTLVQRQAPTTAPAADHVAELDGLMNRWWVDQEIVDVIGRMSAAEKTTVINGYRDRLAHKLSFPKLQEAVRSLGANLPTKLDWMRTCAIFGTAGISWTEIKSDVESAPQAERDMLKNEAWKSYFIGVCTNSNIVEAVKALNFDLPTQLTWVHGEANATLSITVSMLTPLLSGRTPAELDSVSGEWWLHNFWTAVCNNDTVVDLVKILFPGDLVKQLHYMVAEGTDVGKVKARITEAPEAQRTAIYASPEIVALIKGFDSDADKAAIVHLIGGTPAQQMSLFGNMTPIELLNWPTPSQDWVDAIKGARTDPLDVLTVAGTNLAWAPFIRPRLADLFRGHVETVYGAERVNMVWEAYGNGSAFVSADTLVVFRALFGGSIRAAGDDYTETTGFAKRKRYHMVDPDDATARELMKMVRPLGRNEVAAAPIGFCDVVYEETLGFHGWTGTATALGTSYFMGDQIIIQVSSAGHMADNAIPGSEAYGGATATGTGGSALTYFQNHVRHEIGHAVGNKAVGGMSESGDDFADKYGGWHNSSQSAFLASMWAPVGRPSTGWPSVNFGGGAVVVNDEDVRDWLVGLLADAAECDGPIKNGTQSVQQKVTTLAGSLWGPQRLTSYVAAIVAGGAQTPSAIQDGAYEFPGFTPPDPVPIYSTREGGRFVTYSKAAYDALQASTGWYSLSSHYEMFAEMYTRKYSGGGTPAAVNGKDPADFFTKLEAQRDPMFGEPASPPTVAE